MSQVQASPATPPRLTEEADVVSVHGGKPLVGEVSVRGAKNLVTKAMVASLLADEPSVLRSVPDIRDVAVVRGLLEAHAVSVTNTGTDELTLDPRSVKSAHFAEIDAHAGSSRIPILFVDHFCTSSVRPLSPTSVAATSATGRLTSTSMLFVRSVLWWKKHPPVLP